MKCFCKIVLRFGNLTAVVSTFYAFLRCVCVNLCSAGIDSEEKVVNVVSHSSLVGQHRAISIKFP